MGLKASSGDCVAVMDADLKDPPDLLSQMFEKWLAKEAQIIYARENLTQGRELFAFKTKRGILYFKQSDF
ncbi:glycosyltransferase [Helicobacter sp. MIT 14-3879]|uniref:glycosyltransferase n=1 Tax=Helicobacter sp. MIT 14-3879 TaxID=2040649 RepID=UPI0021633F01|nr:glycosyltransferase [Helicobacter sp. MIT 14-3879]